MKAIAKLVCDGIACVLVLPAVFFCCLSSCFGTSRAFSGWSQAFSLIPGTSGAVLRRAFYGFLLPRCGARTWLSFGTIFSHRGAEVGRNVYVGPYCCLGNVTLDDDVLLGSQVSVMNGSAEHAIERVEVPIREQPGVWPRVRIGRDTWIGDRAVVMADVGAHCVIGAGSVVTKPIPDYAIAVGTPAKVIRYREGAPVAAIQVQGAE